MSQSPKAPELPEAVSRQDGDTAWEGCPEHCFHPTLFIPHLTVGDRAMLPRRGPCFQAEVCHMGGLWVMP